jgi:hypothetical protein
VLAWFRDQPDIPRLDRGLRISQATADRYLNEVIEVLAANGPSLRQTLEKAKDFGLLYLILGGGVIASDRRGKAISRKGREIDRSCLGKTHYPQQELPSAGRARGFRPRVSDALPGGTHDLIATRQQVLRP